MRTKLRQFDDQMLTTVLKPSEIYVQKMHKKTAQKVYKKNMNMIGNCLLAMISFVGLLC